MVFTALALIAFGIVLGLFFPVMFVAALAGVVLLVLFFVAGARRTKAETESADPGVDTLR
jgi:H+/Cl- antiporter ClcA